MADHARRRHHRPGTAVPRTVLLLLVLAMHLAAGCGLAAERTARPVSTEESVVVAVPAEPTSTGVVQIYLLRDDRLVPVDRAGRSATDALESLIAGPTPLDGEAGLTTALPPHVVNGVSRPDPAVVTVDVAPAFTALSARDQLLAAAQVVWTATGGCCDTRVRVQAAGVPLPVPTDGGLVDRPVGRDDYRSLAPL
jgi:hypothetical protein